MLVVRISLRNHLICNEGPATLSNTPSHFLPFPASAQLQILPSHLKHQFVSVASVHSSPSYLIPNSAIFSGDFLYSSVIMVQIKMSRFLANFWPNMVNGKHPPHHVNMKELTNDYQTTLRPGISVNVFHLHETLINSLGTLDSCLSDNKKVWVTLSFLPFLN